MLAGAAVLGGCGDDGSTGGTTTTTPGVTFEQDVTVPTDAAGDPDPEAVPLDPGDEVEAFPGEVPSAFPDDFPVPEGATVELGSSGRAEGEVRVAVDYAVADTTPARVHRFYLDAVDGAGHRLLLEDADGRGDDFVGLVVFETADYVGNVLVAGDGRAGVLLTLTATLPG